MSSDSSSLKAVLYALGANFGISIVKTAAALITGSGAMLAESLHSFADCGNQLLLLLGMKQAKKPPSEDHPMGYGRVVYFWALMVSLMLFSVGGLFSIIHGLHSLWNPEPVKFLVPSIGVLIVAMVLEGSALKGALAASKAERGEASLWQWFKDTRQSELLVVVGEDIAALLGLVIALIALSLTAITGNTMYDALGSIAVGVLLIAVAFVVFFEVKSFLTGESVSPKLRAEIRAFVNEQPEVDYVVNMITQQFGDYFMLALKVKMKPMPSDVALVAAINEVEERMQRKFTSPRLKYSFFEPDAG